MAARDDLNNWDRLVESWGGHPGEVWPRLCPRKPSKPNPVRLRNSPYFCVFKYARLKYIYQKKSTREQSNKRSGTRLKTESETGERRKKIGLTSPSGVWGSRASRDNLVPRALFPKPGKSALGTRLLARVRLLRHGYRFLYRFWEKNGLFCSLNPV